MYLRTSKVVRSGRQVVQEGLGRKPKGSMYSPGWGGEGSAGLWWRLWVQVQMTVL